MQEAEIIKLNKTAGTVSDLFYRVIRRGLDIVLSLILFVGLLPLMAVIALLIVLDSPGSFLYVQERIGKHGRPFKMYKFRTMRSDHDSSEEAQYMADYVAGRVKPNINKDGVATFKSAKTDDITRVGRFLRKTSLDELPQLINVLRGEMSLVGPRPNLPVEVAQYTPIQYQRLAVLPGITGLAQVRGRSMITFNEIVAHDLEYVYNQSLKLDLQILWWTFMQVLRQQDVE
jgi:lipopolysaccharide/colanic/teichoic acid biosynthesis glycosyltransferase